MFLVLCVLSGLVADCRERAFSSLHHYQTLSSERHERRKMRSFTVSTQQESKPFEALWEYLYKKVVGGCIQVDRGEYYHWTYLSTRSALRASKESITTNGQRWLVTNRRLLFSAMLPKIRYKSMVKVPEPSYISPSLYTCIYTEGKGHGMLTRQNCDLNRQPIESHQRDANRQS